MIEADYVVVPNMNPNIRALYTLREGDASGYVSGVCSRPVIGWGKYGHAIIPNQDGEPVLAMNGWKLRGAPHVVVTLEYIYGMDEPETYPPFADNLLYTRG